MEIWKDIKGYENIYQVSTLGRIRSVDRVVSTKNGNRKLKGSLMKGTLNKSGYITICLKKDKKQKNFYVARIVAINFIDNNLNKPQVNHISGNKLDNSVYNLEWTTAKENKQHAVANGLTAKGENNGGAKLKESEVKIIREIYSSKKMTIIKIAEMFNVGTLAISRIVGKRTWKHI